MCSQEAQAWVRWQASDKEFAGFDYSSFACCWELYENTEQEAAGV